MSFLRRRDPRFELFGLGPEQTSLRGLWLLMVVFFGSLIVAAILTPPAHWLVEWWAGRWPSMTVTWMLGKGVDLYFDRIRLVLIVAGLPWLMTACHLWSWRAMGLWGGWKKFALGWGGGVLLVGILSLGQRLFTQIGAKADVNYAQLAMEAVLAGLILGFLEETIFRGLILRIFYTASKRPWLALAVTSAFYAYTHFKVPTMVWLWVAPGVHWDTGFFVAYWTTFGIVADFDWAQFIVLWLLGMTLGGLALRTGSLLPNIGLHAGLVAAMIFYRGTCTFPADAGRAFWGGGGLADGWAAAILVAAVFAAVVGWPGKKKEN